MEGWVGLVGSLTADSLPTKWSTLDRRKARKVCLSDTNILTAEFFTTVQPASLSIPLNAAFGAESRVSRDSQPNILTVLWSI